MQGERRDGAEPGSSNMKTLFQDACFTLKVYPLPLSRPTFLSLPLPPPPFPITLPHLSLHRRYVCTKLVGYPISLVIRCQNKHLYVIPWLHWTDPCCSFWSGFCS